VRKFTLDELMLKKWQGWDMTDCLFVSIIGELSFLRTFEQLVRPIDYAGVRGMSVIVVCSPDKPTDAYREIEKMMQYGVENAGIWMVGHPHIIEVVFYGKRSRLEGHVFLTDEWRAVVNQLAAARSGL
jgi:hypothetical protein